MKIDNHNQTSFGIKLKTVEVIETAATTVLQSDGLEGIKNVIRELSGKPLKHPGHLGFRHQASVYGEQICAKYPQIADIVETINEIKSHDKFIRKDNLYEQVKPMIDKLGKEIDIEI